MKGGYSRKSVLTGITSFLIVLFTMPLGHALMIFMEHVLSSTALHYAAFTMGAVGLVMVIIGVFAKGDTRQTLWGLFGGLLFWTGWVEFIYVYYAHRYEVQPLLNAAGEVVTKPEYLIMPSSFGFWVMFMLIYIFSIKSGCDFFTYLQKVFFRKSTTTIVVRPMTRHTIFHEIWVEPMAYTTEMITILLAFLALLAFLFYQSAKKKNSHN